MEMQKAPSRDLVDPELVDLLDSVVLPDLSLENLHVLRDMFQPEPHDNGHDGVAENHCQITSSDGASLRLRVLRRADASGLAPVVLYVHGGGFVSGSPELFDFYIRPLVAQLGVVVVGVAYRQAPESVFPSAVEDCYAALRWIWTSASEQSFDLGRVGVLGESAGGGLAAALALLARDRGDYRLAFQMLFEPMLDDRTGSSHEPCPDPGRFVWTASNNQFGWRSMLGREPGTSDVSPYAAPARATDLSGLPPTFIAVGALDLFMAEDIEYARRLIGTGVPTELHVIPGAFHGFYLQTEAKVTDMFVRLSTDALRRFVSRG
jgi:acetyl esterase/lipase